MEVIISVAIIVSALVVSIVLVSYSVSGTTASKTKIIATNLTQEGLEIVRNIRDNNWLVGKTGPDDGQTDWRDGLGEGQWRVQYDQQNLLSYSSAMLRKNSNGFYQYSSGSNTGFRRIITIEYDPVDDNKMKVICEVTWQEKGISRSVLVETQLYNWYGGIIP